MAYKMKKDRIKAIMKCQYAYIKSRHNKNSMKGNLMSFDFFFKISFTPCIYCGTEYSKIAKDRAKYSYTTVKLNGIDRLDSMEGYTENNSVSCCSVCNYAKHEMSEKEFFKWIAKVYEYNNI